jgi:hypothetical protein
MNIETRAREAAENLRTTSLVDVEGGLARLHRTHHRRTAGKLVAAAAVIATAVGVAQVQRDQDDAAPARYDGPPVLVWGSGGDWDDPITGQQDEQSYPHFVAADPATSRFLMADGWEHDSWTTYMPGSRDEVHIYPCIPYCGDVAVLGPGDDEITTLDPGGIVILGPGSDLDRGHMGPFFDDASRRELVARGGGPHGGMLAWAPDDEQLALTRKGVYNDGVTVEVVIRDRSSKEDTPVYETSVPTPDWVEPGHGDDPYMSPSIKALAWSADSRLLAFVLQTWSEQGPGDEAFDWTLFVADVDSGETEEVAELVPCETDDRYGSWGCYLDLWIAWAPDGERLSVLASQELSTYNRDGELLETKPTLRQGPIVWFGSE